MARLVWDKSGEKLFEAGVDHCALYLNKNGTYPKGVAWNGIVNITESPTGAESNKGYADNIQYYNLVSAEELEGSIEAFMFPPEWYACDGYEEPAPGVLIGQQSRSVFGLAYRTKIGNDTDGQDHGYKLHLIYGALASPSEKSYDTINDSPDAMTMSWDFSTTPVDVDGFKPTSILVLDSTKVPADVMTAIESELYGTDGVSTQADDEESSSSSSGDAHLPLPGEILAMMPSGVALRAARFKA